MPDMKDSSMVTTATITPPATMDHNGLAAPRNTGKMGHNAPRK